MSLGAGNKVSPREWRIKAIVSPSETVAHFFIRLLSILHDHIFRMRFVLLLNASIVVALILLVGISSRRNKSVVTEGDSSERDQWVSALDMDWSITTFEPEFQKQYGYWNFFTRQGRRHYLHNGILSQITLRYQVPRRSLDPRIEYEINLLQHRCYKFPKTRAITWSHDVNDEEGTLAITLHVHPAMIHESMYWSVQDANTAFIDLCVRLDINFLGESRNFDQQVSIFYGRRIWNKRCFVCAWREITHGPILSFSINIVGIARESRFKRRLSTGGSKAQSWRIRWRKTLVAQNATYSL